MEQKVRCGWADSPPINRDYHDNEWGRPVHDDKKLFELFFLETMQAGLSWITILKKREAFRAAFDGFDVNKIARYDEQKIQSLLQDSGIIRSRNKIEAAIINACAVLEIQREYGSFCNYLWGFSGEKVVLNPNAGFRTTSPLSDRVTEDMKRRGMKYAGSVTIYSFLQAAGIVNDHEQTCFRYPELMAQAGPDGVRFE